MKNRAKVTRNYYYYSIVKFGTTDVLPMCLLEYDYYLEHPEDVLYNQYTYYKRRLSPKVDIRIVFFWTITIVRFVFVCPTLLCQFISLSRRTCRFLSYNTLSGGKCTIKQ